MKHIHKQEEPQEFVDWKLRGHPDWSPTFENLRGSPTHVDRILKSSLINEQGGICCYCEQKITEADSHFEHFRPQSYFDKTDQEHEFNENSLDYSNLLCSCIKDPGQVDDLHCGHFKAEWYDQTLLISPLDPHCEEHFAFTSDGRIEPLQQTDLAAQATIKHLGLNNGDLSVKRKILIDIFNGGGEDILTCTVQFKSSNWSFLNYLFGV